ncbi:hypothetical protein FBY22_3970 [Streptomyces sp. SLBN-31]|nr:hypothetical protein FBY22_3970 [Streptomyces sp. SLBN-31]
MPREHRLRGTDLPGRGRVWRDARSRRLSGLGIGITEVGDSSRFTTRRVHEQKADDLPPCVPNLPGIGTSPVHLLVATVSGASRPLMSWQSRPRLSAHSNRTAGEPVSLTKATELKLAGSVISTVAGSQHSERPRRVRRPARICAGHHPHQTSVRRRRAYRRHTLPDGAPRTCGDLPVRPLLCSQPRSASLVIFGPQRLQPAAHRHVQAVARQPPRPAPGHPPPARSPGSAAVGRQRALAGGVGRASADRLHGTAPFAGTERASASACPARAEDPTPARDHRFLRSTAPPAVVLGSTARREHPVRSGERVILPLLPFAASRGLMACRLADESQAGPVTGAVEPGPVRRNRTLPDDPRQVIRRQPASVPRHAHQSRDL